MTGWASKKRKSQEYDSEDEDEGSEPDLGDDEEDEHVPDDEDDEEDEFEDDVIMDDELDGGAAAADSERFIFTFPIRVAFDENNKVKRLPGPPIVLQQHYKSKHPRAAHRNVILSEDDDDDDHEESEFNRDDSTDVEGGHGAVIEPEPEEPAAEVIAVATKQVASPPEENPVAIKAPEVPTATPVKPPLTPSTGTPTSLAFRGSPEKPQQAPVSINLGV